MAVISAVSLAMQGAHEAAAATLPPVLFLMGPTASGKTALAVELVQRFPFEIISVDSAQVYRGMDIGTAKPDLETLRLAPHRLIDILDPGQAYSVAQFRADALNAIEQIHARGGIPLLAGGTMLYYRALQRGLSDLPPADPQVRARLEKEVADRGVVALYARLEKVDPVAAARIHRHDTQRIQRALEVYELSGQTMTELYAHGRNEMTAFRTLKLIVAPIDRQVLHRRIEQRFQHMLEQGFVAEVAGLRARGDLNPKMPAMRAVGYRQLWDYLEGLTNYGGMMQRGVAATRQFAKRQLTWLRAEPDVVWLDSAMNGLLKQAIDCLRKVRFLPG